MTFSETGFPTLCTVSQSKIRSTTSTFSSFANTKAVTTFGRYSNCGLMFISLFKKNTERLQIQEYIAHEECEQETSPLKAPKLTPEDVTPENQIVFLLRFALEVHEQQEEIRRRETELKRQKIAEEQKKRQLELQSRSTLLIQSVGFPMKRRGSWNWRRRQKD